MSNRHVKTINGRKYYYESVRRGKKVTSKYLGPVEPVRKKKELAAVPRKEEESPEENYIG